MDDVDGRMKMNNNFEMSVVMDVTIATFHSFITLFNSRKQYPLLVDCIYLQSCIPFTTTTINCSLIGYGWIYYNYLMIGLDIMSDSFHFNLTPPTRSLSMDKTSIKMKQQNSNYSIGKFYDCSSALNLFFKFCFCLNSYTTNNQEFWYDSKQH